MASNTDRVLVCRADEYFGHFWIRLETVSSQVFWNEGASTYSLMIVLVYLSFYVLESKTSDDVRPALKVTFTFAGLERLGDIVDVDTKSERGSYTFSTRVD